jgi:hypothetical protein
VGCLLRSTTGRAVGCLPRSTTERAVVCLLRSTTEKCCGLFAKIDNGEGLWVVC